MLFAWPVLTLILMLRLPLPRAILISLIGGYLLLPTEGGIDLPILPPFNKNTIPSLSLLVLGFFIYRARSTPREGPSPGMAQDLPGWVPRLPILLGGVALMVVGAQMTALTNGDPLRYGTRVLQGLQVYDGLSITLTGFTMLVPLILGRKFFAHPDRHRLLLQGVIIAALAISVLALYEIRMSPQLNRIVYGYFPHSWAQHVRNGGFRPLVFMNHGLQLSIFFTFAIIAAFGLYRAVEPGQKSRYLLAGLWLLATVFLSNSLGAFVIAGLFVPLVLLLGPRAQILCAAGIASVVLVYPMLRSADVVPTDRLVAMAAMVHEDRAGSLQFRFNNEDVLLEHARERPLFGWGIFDRARVFTDYGADITTIDGAWIAVMGEGGWAGYLALFGFLALPPIFLAIGRRRMALRPETVILGLIVAAALIDLIPNGFLSPITLLIAGALWGRLEQSRASQAAVSDPAAASTPDPDAVPQPDAVAASTRQRGPARSNAYTRQTQRHQRPKVL